MSRGNNERIIGFKLWIVGGPRFGCNHPIFPSIATIQFFPIYECGFRNAGGTIALRIELGLLIVDFRKPSVKLQLYRFMSKWQRCAVKPQA